MLKDSEPGFELRCKAGNDIVLNKKNLQLNDFGLILLVLKFVNIINAAEIRFEGN